MKSNYQSLFGFTIGPIYEMMSHSKKTRELWFSSFFFSWYVKLFCEKLAKAGFEIIIPKIKGLPPKSRAGFFPDHVIGYSNKSKDDTLLELSKNILDVNNFFIKEIENLKEQEIIKKEAEEISYTKTITEIFNDFLQTSICCIEVDNIKDDADAVNKIENILFAFEKSRTYTLGENENSCFRCKSLPSIIKIIEKNDRITKYDFCPLCFYKLRAYKSVELQEVSDINESKPFPPIDAVTTKELEASHKDVYKKLYYGDHKENEYLLVKNKFLRVDSDGKTISDFKTYHKYLAIVNADGDDLGKLVSTNISPSNLSEQLSSFSLEAYNLNAKFGTEPIYLGGDDLLVFMPVIYHGNTIIDYILELKKLYIKNLKLDNSNPTISFGVGISYYKYPLAAALKDAQDLLFVKAKNEPGKNSLVLQLTQHSGSRLIITFSFNDENLINTFNKFLKAVITSEREGKPIHPHAIHHKLNRFRTLLTNTNDKAQIDEFFINQFNESVHKTMDGIDIVKELLLANISFRDDAGSVILYPKDELEKQFDNCMGQIKFIKFLIGD